MIQSILTSVKKVLGVAENETAFDEDILMHINSALGTLNDIGIGPEFGLRIEDAEATWDDFIGTDPRLDRAKTYVYLSVKIIWDRIEPGYLLKALQDEKEELLVRLSTYREATGWVNPFGVPAEELVVIDGGTP